MLFHNTISLISIFYLVFTVQQWVTNSQECCQEEHCHLSQKLQCSVIASKHQRSGAKVASSWNLVIDNHLTDCIEKYNNTFEWAECCLRLMTPGSEDFKIEEDVYGWEHRNGLNSQGLWISIHFNSISLYLNSNCNCVLNDGQLCSDAIDFRMEMRGCFPLIYVTVNCLLITENLKPTVIRVLASSLQKVPQGSCRDAG